jgi:hypothetical protein
VGFTFIKSFGNPEQLYAGWFFYYIVTLPIFMAHTYLVAYVLIPRYTQKRKIPVFIVLFIILFYGFSVLELILTNEFIYQYYPAGSKITEQYLSPGDVITSGLGNLYIVLVFLAARTVRAWYLAEGLRQELQKVSLQQQMEDAMTKVQPMMLLYSIEHIDRMVDRSDPEVTKAIALTSELLSEVMMYHEDKHHLFAREIDLIKKLVNLVEIFKKARPEVEFFISGDPGHIKLPPLIIFSFVDFVFRRFDDALSYPELNIEASGFSNMVTIQVLQEGTRSLDQDMEECMQVIFQLEKYYADRVFISYEKHSYGCSVIIKNLENGSANTIHTSADVFDMAKPSES